jgi:hypothetical protein
VNGRKETRGIGAGYLRGTQCCTRYTAQAFLIKKPTSELTTGVASTTKALAGEVATNLQAWTKAVRRMPRVSELSPAAVPVA